MFAILRRSFEAFALCYILSACAEPSTAERAAFAEESDGGQSASQHKALRDWFPHPDFPQHIAAMDIHPSTNVVFTWTHAGTVCTGNAVNPQQVCGASYTTSPIVRIPTAVAIARGGSGNDVWAWYPDGTMSRGTLFDLTSQTLPQPFPLPAKPGGGTFSASNLLDAGYSNNGLMYYYWSDGALPATIYRTTGTATNPSSHSGATPVAVWNTAIEGIGFSGGGTIYAWYVGNPGKNHWGGNSLNLSN